jgi:dihydropteroate synthase
MVVVAQKMVEDGADILDIGGESTRPGAATISQEEELARVEPILKVLIRSVAVPLSIDTRHPKVARRALELGVKIVNDISGGEDPLMLKLVAEYGASIVLMHMKGTPQNMQQNPSYNDVVEEVETYLQLAMERAQRAGISGENIILDPGIGFGKRVEDNYLLIRSISRLKRLKAPLLYGTSRKSFLREATGCSVDDVLPATLGVDMFLALHGVDILRVHDVQAHRQLLEVVKRL